MDVYLVVKIVRSGIIASGVGHVLIAKQIIITTFGRTILKRRKSSASLYRTWRDKSFRLTNGALVVAKQGQ
jgi:hypothetical protein